MSDNGENKPPEYHYVPAPKMEPGEKANLQEIERYLMDRMGGRPWVLIHQRQNGFLALMFDQHFITNKTEFINMMLHVINQVAEAEYVYQGPTKK